MFNRKSLASILEANSDLKLTPSLRWFHLIALGVGAIVGTGILTLIGIGADKADPAVIVSFVIAEIICCCSALAYAEMATQIPIAGGAYTYAYVVIGEGIAWMVGWSLILEYSLVVSTVAVGWSGYAGPLMIDTHESAKINSLLVVLLLFVVLAGQQFNAAHLEPFMPFGFAKTVSADGIERGVMVAATIIFFAFYGFDAIATAAEETHNPNRDLAIGIVGSMLVCVGIYMAVAVTAL